MASRTSASRNKSRRGVAQATPAPWWQSGRVRVIAVALAVLVLAVGALGIVYTRSSGGSASGAAGQYPFQVGRPAPGEMAQAIRLPATDGTTFDLSALRGQTVLLFFQEGVGCEPCWNQIKDIETNFARFRALGVDKFVSITTDPLNVLKEKVSVEKISTPVLSDSNGAVSRSWQANRYGMMGDQMDGHSFVLINKDGAVAWRADYGGAPKYIMYMPVDNLLADMRKGLGRATLVEGGGAP